MALENVIQEVLEQGRKEADTILKEGGKEVLAILNEARDKAQQIKIQKEKELKLATERLRSQQLSATELDNKKIILSAKKEILDTVKKETLKRLGTLSKEKNEALLNAMFLRATKEIQNGYVYCNERDKAFVEKIMKFKFAGTINCIGGLLFENEDNTLRIDYRFESILEEVWRDSLKTVAEAVFK